MAEIIHFGVEYDTATAAAQVAALNNQLDKLDATQKAVTRGSRNVKDVVNNSAAAMRSASLGVAKLGEALLSGNISAVGMASSLGRLTVMLLGPFGVGIAAAAAGLVLFIQQQKKAQEQAKKFEDQLRDVSRRVRDLMNPGSSTPFTTEVEKITDAIKKLNEQIDKQTGNIFERMFGGASLKDFFMSIGRFLFGGATPGSGAQLQGLQDQRASINALTAEQRRFARDTGISQSIATATGEGQIGVFNAQIAALREHLANLAQIEGPAAREAFIEASRELGAVTIATDKWVRALKLQEDMLFTVADAIEDFVLRGTAAFRQLLDNMFRVLFRDFSGNIISGIIRGQTGEGRFSPVTFEPPPIDPGVPIGLPSGNIMPQVNFNVQAIDAQGVAAFFEREGPRLAVEVTKQIERSGSMRRRIKR